MHPATLNSKMKNVLCFVFLLTFALVLSHQDAQKRGGWFSRSFAPVTSQSTIEALTKLVEVGAPILETPDAQSCYQDMMMNSKKIADSSTGILYDFQTTCYVVGESDLTVSVVSKTDPDVPPGSKQCCALSQAFQAVFLPFEPKKDTYMILDPSVVRWFFTSTLSGCDIFVAVDQQLGNRPIVIHSNRNNCGNKLQNLQVKGTSADLMLKSHPDYTLIARVYGEPLPDEKAGPYLKQYATQHAGIKLISYNTNPPAIAQAFYFIGHYVPEQWKFIVKGKTDGTTKVLDLPPSL